MVAASKFVLAGVAALAAGAYAQDPELNVDVDTGKKLFEGDIVAEFDQIATLYGIEQAIEFDKAGLIEKHAGHEERRRLRAEQGLTGDDVDTPFLREAERLLGAPITNNNLLWPGKTLYYTVSSPVNRALIQNNLNVLNQRTGIRFVEGTGNGNYVRVQQLSGCYSYIGTIGGAQDLSIGTGCTRDGTVQHEFMHALGLYHEQSNANRDSYVSINLNNVQSGTENNFAKANSNDLGIAYDYGSVMHYSATAFSANGGKTINAIGGTASQNLANENRMGQRVGISTTDAIQLQLMYHCPSGARSIFDLCTPECPCDAGQGDCDTDADCKGNLVCIQTDGAANYNFLGQQFAVEGLDVCGTGTGGGGSTPPPTSNTCADRVPSGLTYTNGNPAPCVELPSYCNLDIVQEACPATCNLCREGDVFQFTPRQIPLGVPNPVLVDPKSYTAGDRAGDEVAAGTVGVGTLSGVAAGAAVFGGLVVAAGFVVYNRNKQTTGLTVAAGDAFENFRVQDDSLELNGSKV